MTVNVLRIAYLKIISDICHFFTQQQFEAKKFYTWKCVNLQQKLSCNKTYNFTHSVKVTQSEKFYTQFCREFTHFQV